MSDDKIPEAVLRRHPQLAIVGQALDAHRRGEPLTLACPTCGASLTVTDVEEVHVTVVACASGHTLFRGKRSSDRIPMLVSRDDAVTHGLAPVTIRCDAKAAGLYARTFPIKNVFVALNGPPGGPLVVMVWDCTSLGSIGVEAAVRATFVDAASQPLEIVGADRGRVLAADQAGVVFRTGSGRTRIVWFGFIAQIAGAVLLVGLGTSGLEDLPASAETILANSALAAAVRTLSIE